MTPGVRTGSERAHPYLYGSMLASLEQTGYQTDIQRHIAPTFRRVTRIAGDQAHHRSAGVV